MVVHQYWIICHVFELVLRPLSSSPTSYLLETHRNLDKDRDMPQEYLNI